MDSSPRLPENGSASLMNLMKLLTVVKAKNLLWIANEVHSAEIKDLSTYNLDRLSIDTRTSY